MGRDRRSYDTGLTQMLSADYWPGRDSCMLHETMSVVVCLAQWLSKLRPKPSRNSRGDFRSVSNQVGYRNNSREILRDLTGSLLCMAPAALNVFCDSRIIVAFTARMPPTLPR